MEALRKSARGPRFSASTSSKMAQTAPKRNRRPLNVRQQFGPPLALVLASEFIVSGKHAEITFSAPLFGVPDLNAFSLEDDGHVFVAPTSFEWKDENFVLRLNFPPELGGGTQTMQLPPWMPEIRNRQGAWVAPVLLTFITS